MSSDQPLTMIEVYLNAVLILIHNARVKEESLEGLVMQSALLESLQDKISIARNDVKRLTEQSLTAEMHN